MRERIREELLWQLMRYRRMYDVCDELLRTSVNAGIFSCVHLKELSTLFFVILPLRLVYDVMEPQRVKENFLSFLLHCLVSLEQRGRPLIVELIEHSQMEEVMIVSLWLPVICVEKSPIFGPKVLPTEGKPL